MRIDGGLATPFEQMLQAALEPTTTLRFDRQIQRGWARMHGGLATPFEHMLRTTLEPTTTLRLDRHI